MSAPAPSKGETATVVSDTGILPSPIGSAMHRRRFLGTAALAAGAALAGCTASALPSPNADDPGPNAAPLDDCPDLLDADRTRCPGDGGPLAVRRSVPRVAGEDWSLRVAVENVGEATYGTNPYAWSVYRHEDDGWHRVAPDATVEPWLELPPGDTYAWLLTPGETPVGDADQRVFLDLEPGLHAFAVPFRGPDRVAAVAPFEVGG